MKLSYLILPLLISVSGLMAAEATFQNGVDGYTGATDANLIGEVEKQRSLNFGHSEVLEVGGVAAGGLRRLALIQFGDLVGVKGVPEGASIQSAKLELYKIKDLGSSESLAQLPANQKVLIAFSMQRPWKAGLGDGVDDPEGVTFSHVSLGGEAAIYWGEANQIENGPVKGVDYNLESSVSAPLEGGMEEVWMQWDVTEVVRSWVADPQRNFGLLILARSYYVGAQFASCEAQTQEFRPRLVVTY